MQEINELKNLVIQSLEGNGVLGQIRAQIRASVFKIIEMQEANTKKNASFFWENPLCQTIYDHKEGKLALELINEFLEFFKMDYTLSVFSHESNLKDPARRDELQKKMGVRGDNNRPVLFQLISSLLSQGSSEREHQTSSTNLKDNDSLKSLGNKQKPAGTKDITTDFKDTDLNKANFDNFGKSKKPGFPAFEEPPKEKVQVDIDVGRKGKLPPLGGLGGQDKFGINKSQPTDLLSGDFDIKKPAAEPPKKPVEEVKKPLGSMNTPPVDNKFKSQQEDSDHEYDDDVFENVDEELVEDLEDEDIKDRDKKQMFASSEDIIGASQSQGFDVSVDSLALEEYDYYEDAKRAK